MSIRVTSHDEAALAKLQRLGQIVANPGQALRASAQSLRRLVHDTFRDQADPWGSRWPQWAPSTTASRNRSSGSGQILIDTGAMYGSVEARADDSGVEVTVGPEYASYHQFGTGLIPQRAFLPEPSPGAVDVPAAWWLEILFPVELALERAGDGP